MTELQFFQHHVFFTTREFSLFLNIDVTSASRKLKAYVRKGDLVQVTRGIWGNKSHKNFSPYGVISYLLGDEYGYLSFLSALHRHGVISQIPNSIQIATTGRGRVLKTSIGEFQFFKIKPELMREGINVFQGSVTYNIASKEKALIDTFYISTKKGRRFKKLSEIELDNFSAKKFKQYLKNYPIISKRLIETRFQKLR